MDEGVVDRRRCAAAMLIRRYTREAGVRNLERELTNLARKAVKEILLRRRRRSSSPRRTCQTISAFRSSATARPRRGSGRRRDRAGLDRSRRRAADHRRRDDARQRQDDRDRQPEGRDEGIDLGGGLLCPLARRRFRPRAAAVRPARHPRPRSGGSYPEGRSVRRHRHGDRHRLGADRHSGRQTSR